MAETPQGSVYFTPNGDTEKTLFLGGTSTTRFWAQELGWDNPDDEPLVEVIPDQYQNIGRDWTKFKDREYTVVIDHKGSTPSNLETLRKTWNGWHNQSLGYGVLRRIMRDTTTIRALDARPLKPLWDDLEEGRFGVVQRVTQRFLATDPFWRDVSWQTVASAFNGATPVAVSLPNVGSIPVYWKAVITGIVSYPKITLGGKSIEVQAATVNADDTLEINTIPAEAGIIYSEHGAGNDPAWYGYRSTTSEFFSLPVATNAPSLSATSGTASILFSYYQRYISL